jgi:uncharacterized protein (TIGR03083 family)
VLLTPRYDGVPVLELEGSVGDPSMMLVRQQRRFAEVLATFGPDQWASPTRCTRWSVQDVVVHLVGANELWTTSVTAGRAGSPTRLFEFFDPVTTPPRLVDAVEGWTRFEALAHYVAAADAMARAVAGLDGQGWSVTGESPLGHVALRLVLLHALWDSWIHERDVLLPLGLAPVLEPDEVVACLAYVAALGPALLAAGGSVRRGTLAVDGTEPEVQIVVDVGPSVLLRLDTTAAGAARLAGRAVDLIEGLSFRAPMTADVAATDRWLLTGLDAAFDVA